MLKLHIKTTYPEGAQALQSLPNYKHLIATLVNLSEHLLAAEPEIVTTSSVHLRIDTVESMEILRELCIVRHQWALDVGAVDYRAQIGATLEVKIEDTTTNSVVLNWTPFPDTAQPEFVAWVNATLV